MNYDGTNPSVILQVRFDPVLLIAICFQNEVHETTFTTKQSTHYDDVDVSTVVTNHDNVTFIPGLYDTTEIHNYLKTK